tara:strand:+ start:144 stop:509 length:366 start_codon:yes stop_codon:yes gene_type:complete
MSNIRRNIKYITSMKLFSINILACLFFVQIIGLFHAVIHFDFKIEELSHKHSKLSIFDHESDSDTCLLFDEGLLGIFVKSTPFKLIDDFLEFSKSFFYSDNLRLIKKSYFYFPRAPPIKFS